MKSCIDNFILALILLSPHLCHSSVFDSLINRSQAARLLQPVSFALPAGEKLRYAWVRNYEDGPNFLFGAVVDFTILNLDGTIISKATYELLRANKMSLIQFEGIPAPAMVIELKELPLVRYKIRPFDPP